MRRCFSLLFVLVALTWGGSAQAQYLLTGGSGGELQIGTGLPLPIGPAGIFLGGMTSVNGGTSCGAGPGGCAVGVDGPGTAYWPPLLVPPNPNISTGGAATRTVMQNLATAQGGTITLPTAALSRPAPGAPVPIAVFTTNPAVFQVATSIDFAWPAGGPAVFSPGGAPGIPGPTPFVTGTGGGGVIVYGGGTKAFGGPGQFAIVPGPGAGAGRVPANGGGVAPVASVWINFAAGLPSTVGAVAVVGASNPIGLGQPGAPLAAPGGTTMFGPLSPGAGPFGALNVTSMGSAMACVAFCATAMGGIPSSLPLPSITVPTPGGMTAMLAGLSNMVTVSKGFPWTTGFITISQPGAVPVEVFFLSGTDMRVSGVGNVSLVSGSLSARALSGPNANRGWLSLTLPEPTVALGAGGALAALVLLHTLVRRRSH